jgi:tRNA threonylcarbamoyladenosine biosynthesis protein TsaE
LGSDDNFSSPTYSIVNEYQCQSGKIYHFDLYRLNSAEELYDIGFEEYIDSGNYCFIEWPEKTLPFIPKTYLSIVINQNENNRYISAQIKK